MVTDDSDSAELTDEPDVSEEHPESAHWIWAGRHRPPVPRSLMELMSNGWAERAGPPPERHPAADNFAARRKELSERFARRTLVIPSGPPKVRSNDTDYRFRPGTDFFWLTGEMGSDSVLVMEPDGDGHRAILYVEPPNDRSSHEFFLDRRHGEFWVGPRIGLHDISRHLGVSTAPLVEVHEHLERLGVVDTVTVRGLDPRIDDGVPENDADDELLTALSEMRLVKDDFEVAMLQQAVDSTIRGFEDVVKALPDAMESGERVVEGVFNARDEQRHGELKAGYVLTVEPGLYFQPDDLTVPERYRGIGVRIEDDVLVTADGCRVLSEALPSDPDEIEAWIARLSAEG
jgi:Xaa-Pro aminopeptidase